MGAKRRPNAYPRLEARERIPQITVGRLRRSDAAVTSWVWARPLIRCPRAPTLRGFRLIGGNTVYGYEFLYAGPLFTHQLSHVWIDFRGIQDAFMRGKGIDYFENSRRATYVQQQYAIDNPLKFRRL